MPSCAFRKCTSHSRKNNKVQGITFHMFPQDEILKHKWVQILRKQRHEPDWEATKNSRVCCMHFREEDVYLTDRGLKRLSKTAVPYYEDEKKPQTCCSSKSGESQTCPSKSSDNIDISDDESSLELPRIAYLQAMHSQIVADKKELIRVNNNIRRQNKRLNERVQFLTETIVKLKKEISDSQVAIEVDVLNDELIENDEKPMQIDEESQCNYDDPLNFEDLLKDHPELLKNVGKSLKNNDASLKKKNKVHKKKKASLKKGNKLLKNVKKAP